MRNDITNERCLTASRRIRSALEVAEHLRRTFTSSKWLAKHKHMKIHEMVVFYIDKDEVDPSYPRFQWSAVDPTYSTLTGISKKYCFMMCGGGRVASRRFCCFCEACCLAHENGEGLTAQLDIPDCKRRHLSSFDHSAEQITCTAAAGVANAKARAKALWRELKPLLKVGKAAAVQARSESYCMCLCCACAYELTNFPTYQLTNLLQARQLWSKEEKTHLRPGHFWACELGNFDGDGSPIIYTFTKKNEYFTLSNGEKQRSWLKCHTGLVTLSARRSTNAPSPPHP